MKNNFKIGDKVYVSLNDKPFKFEGIAVVNNLKVGNNFSMVVKIMTIEKDTGYSYRPGLTISVIYTEICHLQTPLQMLEEML